jgi:hypothetical protein
MTRVTQVGIAVAVLGLVVLIIGLFPSVTGIEASQGVGLLQIVVILTGFAVLILGAYIYVQSVYYPRIKHNLAQQIAIRLSLTGLVISTASGLADVLGFGSHPPGPDQRPFLGILQAIGMVGGFVIAALGVLLFVVLGDPGGPPIESDDDPPEEKT